MSHGTFLQRLTEGTRWAWLSEGYRAALPEDIETTVMHLDSCDRYHAKQGRSTARVRFDSPWGELSVYLKRHEQLPWSARLRALVDPGGKHSPAAAEWAHLEKARTLGVAVPDAVAVGESIGPWGRLSSFLMVAELTGAVELNEILPTLTTTLPAPEFAACKRSIVAEMAGMVARLHRAHVFHKDLYLCHFFLDTTPRARPGSRLTLIDLHRLGEHRWTAPRWRWKDLGQLLYSTYEIRGIDDRDRLRFWRLYRRAVGLRWPRWQGRIIRAKAGRYRAHNR
jgi:heptose I phosphotransferase